MCPARSSMGPMDSKRTTRAEKFVGHPEAHRLLIFEAAEDVPDNLWEFGERLMSESIRYQGVKDGGQWTTVNIKRGSLHIETHMYARGGKRFCKTCVFHHQPSDTGNGLCCVSPEPQPRQNSYPACNMYAEEEVPVINPFHLGEEHRD